MSRCDASTARKNREGLRPDTKYWTVHASAAWGETMAEGRVLILGTGNAQVDAITYCKQRGKEVHGLGHRRRGAGLRHVDHFEQIDIYDHEGVLHYAESWGADVVYSVGSDSAMPTVGFVSERLGLPCFVSYELATMLRDKSRVRTFLDENNLGPLSHLAGGSLEDFEGWDDFPAILKPVDSEGQRGVFEVADWTALEKHFHASLAMSRSRRVIVEHYVEGPELSANVFVRQGHVAHCLVTDRLVVEGFPGGIVRGHRVPSHAPPGVHSKTVALVHKVVKALGIDDGPVYFQLKSDPKGDVFVIEVAPRLDGCHLWLLLRHHTGVDLLDLSFRALWGEEAPGPRPMRATAPLCLEFFLQPPGTEFREPAEAGPKVMHRVSYYRSGDEVRPINGYTEKTGYEIRPETDLPC